MSTVSKRENMVGLAMSAYASAIFVVLWVGFAVGLLGNPVWLDVLWEWVRGLPGVWEIIVWVSFLPITVALWIGESSWPPLARLVGFAGIVIWTLAAFASLWRASTRQSEDMTS